MQNTMILDMSNLVKSIVESMMIGYTKEDVDAGIDKP